MRTILSLGNGAVTLTEDAGAFTFSVDESLSAGGGPNAGFLSLSGKASVVFNAIQEFNMGVKILEAHSPAALVPIEAAAATMVDAEVSGL